ncbi:MAG: hypothetical protein KDK10_02130 [Maritimibacter sp.]|nr:hypothetical protein [Maritimibacter sp.]
MTEVRRSTDRGTSPENARAEAIALALMGVGTLEADALAEAASWDRPEGAFSGRAAICARAEAQRADLIRIEEVVTHGRAGTVSGRVTRGTETRLFCHVIRFTTASAHEIAQLVSFEHPVPRPSEPRPKGA